MRTKYGFNTTEQRSRLMKRIGSKNTKYEVIFRKALWNKGVRYRLHSKTVTGNPDILINKFRIVVFIDGEFWHGYNWEEKKKRIKSNREYWIKKIENNIERDKSNNIKLAEEGWRVFRFWEHEIKKNLDNCLNQIIQAME